MFIFVRKNLLTQYHAVNAGPKISLSFPTPTFTLPSPNVKYSITLPAAYVPLLLNTLTQLLCVSGVHRLTTSVSSLTVTLVLVVRKAVSLVISVMVFGDGEDVNGRKAMWGGAALVLIGTIGYSIGSRKRTEGDKKKVD